MSTHPTPQTMSTNVNTGSQSITENAVVLSTSQAVVPSNLGTLMKNANIDKTSPYYLAERIESFGNAGATLFIQQGTDITHLTNKFYLQGMNISLKERVQIQETFGSPIASFFGESVKVYNFSGVCLEYASTRASKKGEYFQGSSLMHLYNHSMRGTQLVKSNSIAVLQVMNHTI
ncbi:MAG: hypothetical protein H8E12_14745 [Rhodobacteraceae bacterium]|nr:hypothetical protein [Paracoccaceae bacterium]